MSADHKTLTPRTCAVCGGAITEAGRPVVPVLGEVLGLERRERHWEYIECVDNLVEKVERLERDGVPGVMHAVDQAFYDLAIKERDWERKRVDRLEAALQEIAMLDDTGHGRSRRRKLAQAALRGESA